MPTGGFLGAIAHRVNGPARVGCKSVTKETISVTADAPGDPANLQRQATGSLPLHLRHLEALSGTAPGGSVVQAPPRRRSLFRSKSRGSMQRMGSRSGVGSRRPSEFKRALSVAATTNLTAFGTCSRGAAVQVHISELNLDSNMMYSQRDSNSVAIS